MRLDWLGTSQKQKSSDRSKRVSVFPNHFSFNKFRGTAPDFRKYMDLKNVVTYCVFALTHLESNGSQVTSLI